MNDDRLGDELRAEIPAPGDGYWAAIDDRLTIADGEIGPRTDTGLATNSGTATDIGTAVTDRAAVDTGSAPSAMRRQRWPLAIAAALLLVAGVFVGNRLSNDDTVDVGVADDPTNLDAQPGPVLNRDHWHSVYGVWDCTANDGAGGWLAPFESMQDDTGIHSHGDGLIHIHPFFEISAGKNAVFGHFADEMGFEVTNDALLLDDGRVLSEAVDTCGGEPAVLQLRRWQSDVELLADPTTPPRVITENLEAERFYNDREVWTLAFAPIDADVPLPPSPRFDTLVQNVPAIDFNPAAGDAGAGPVEPPAPANLFDNDQSNTGQSSDDQAIEVPFADFEGQVAPGTGKNSDLAQTFEERAAELPQPEVVAGSASHRITVPRVNGDLYMFYFDGTIRGGRGDQQCVAMMDENDILEVGCSDGGSPQLSWGKSDDLLTVSVAHLPKESQWLYVRTSDAKTILVNVFGGASYAQWEPSLGDVVSIRVTDQDDNEVWSFTDF